MKLFCGGPVMNVNRRGLWGTSALGEPTPESGHGDITEALAPATGCSKLQLPAIAAGEILDGLTARACKGALITSKGRGGS